MLMLRNVLKTVADLEAEVLVIKFNFCSDFGQDFKVEVQARI